MLASSDPSETLSPYGGGAAITPNPIAIGYPGTQQPVDRRQHFDHHRRRYDRRRRPLASFEHPWLMDANGKSTNNPHVIDPGRAARCCRSVGLNTDTRVRPSLMVEMLTHGLAGSPPGFRKALGRQCLCEVFDSAARGREAFLRLADYTIDRRHANAKSILPSRCACPVKWRSGTHARRRAGRYRIVAAGVGRGGKRQTNFWCDFARTVFDATECRRHIPLPDVTQSVTSRWNLAALLQAKAGTKSLSSSNRTRFCQFN